MPAGRPLGCSVPSGRPSLVKGVVARLLHAGVALVLGAACAARPPWQEQLEGAGIGFISARELKGMIDRQEDFVLVDARDEVWFRRGHIPGAISIPAEDASLAAVDIRRPKRLLHPERLPADRGRLLVFYCGGPT
jgi:rhodanese-related sulfurtransferase